MYTVHTYTDTTLHTLTRNTFKSTKPEHSVSVKSNAIDPRNKAKVN